MKSKRKSKGPQKSTAFSRARAAITRHGNIRTGLGQYKKDAPAAELHAALPELLASDIYKKLIWPHPMPRAHAEMISAGLPIYGAITREIEWAILTLAPYYAEINRFLELKREYERTLLIGDKDKNQIILDTVKDEFGYSLWLLESRIAATQMWEGLAQQKELTNSLLNDDSLSPPIRFILSWISFRSEANISQKEFRKLLNENIPARGGYFGLLHIILGGCPSLGEEDAAYCLAYTDMFPLIDRYHYALATLHAYLANGTGKPKLDLIRPCIESISSKISDPTLARLAIILGGSSQLHNIKVVDALDAYSSGEYRTSIELSTSLVSQDMSIDALQTALRGALKEGCNDVIHIGEGDCLLRRIRDDLEHVVGFSPEAPAAASRLSKIALTHANTEWAPSLALAVSRQSRDERIFPPSGDQIYQAIRAGSENPIFCFSFEKFSAGYRYLKALSSQSGGSLTCDAMAALLQDSASLPVLLSPEHKNKLVALSALRRNDNHTAIELLRTPFEANRSRVQRYESGLNLAEALFRTGDLLGCAETCAEMVLESAYLGSLLPIERLVDRIVELENDDMDKPPATRGTLAGLIVFDIYSKYVSPNRDAERADAFRDFLRTRRIKHASELISNRGGISGKELKYLLRYICVPVVLDQSHYLKTSREVENERAKILVQLSELITSSGESPPLSLNEELQQIRTKQVIRDTTHELDKSKIFVDTDGIKRALGVQIKETWSLYRLLTIQDRQGSSIEDVFKIVQDLMGTKFAYLTPSMPLTERNKLFERTVAEIRDRFATDKVFGLDANLSTNIRHGYILRELRKPFVAAHLVTNKATESSEYQPNLYWIDRLGSGENDEAILAALSTLSKEVDEEIEYLVSRALRIWSDSAPEGLFDYTLTHPQLQIIQRHADDAEGYEEFLEAIFAALWVLTESLLKRVRNVIMERTLRHLLTSLGSLQESLEQACGDRDISALVTAINLVRPEVRAAAERVTGWFELSDSREYQNYDLKIAFDAALATVETYYSDLKIKHTFSSPVNLIMIGDTLPYFTRFFSILIENVAEHSGIKTGTVWIKCAVEEGSGMLSVHMTNQLAESIDVPVLIARAKQLNKDFAPDKASSRIGVEGNSGYPKIWKILTHDLARDHEVSVSLQDNNTTFSVEVLMTSHGIVV